MSEELKDKSLDVSSARANQAEEAASLGLDISKINRATAAEEAAYGTFDDSAEAMAEELSGINLNKATASIEVDVNDNTKWKIDDWVSPSLRPYRVPLEILKGQGANPNITMPREFDLLCVSVLEDGVTMTSVCMPCPRPKNDKKVWTVEDVEKEYPELLGAKELCSPERLAKIKEEHIRFILMFKNGYWNHYKRNKLDEDWTLEQLQSELGPDIPVDFVLVIDGFHRSLVQHKDPKLFYRERGLLPCSFIIKPMEHRIGSMIRHNRARGSHSISVMQDLVVELKRRRWSDEKIMQQLGMEKEEIYRLQVQSGIAALFENQEFDQSYELVFDDGTEVSFGDGSASTLKEIGRKAVLENERSKEQAQITAEMMTASN